MTFPFLLEIDTGFRLGIFLCSSSFPILETIIMALAHQDLLDPKQSKPSSLSDNIISTKAKVQFAQYHEKDEHNDGTNDDEHHESTFTLSEGSKSIASKSSSYRNIGLRSNLTRHIHGRDPLFVRYYLHYQSCWYI